MFNFRMFNDVFNITDVQFQKKKFGNKNLVRKKSFNSNSHIRRTPQFLPEKSASYTRKYMAFMIINN